MPGLPHGTQDKMKGGSPRDTQLRQMYLMMVHDGSTHHDKGFLDKLISKQVDICLLVTRSPQEPWLLRSSWNPTVRHP